jgi:alkylation response protein AidB-like acyl-CoA dehydrogenase
MIEGNRPKSQKSTPLVLRLSEAGLSTIGDAVHLHGGMGIASEYPIGHHFTAALAFPHLWGTTAFHLERILSDDRHNIEN